MPNISYLSIFLSNHLHISPKYIPFTLILHLVDVRYAIIPFLLLFNTPVIYSLGEPTQNPLTKKNKYIMGKCDLYNIFYMKDFLLQIN